MAVVRHDISIPGGSSAVVCVSPGVDIGFSPPQTSETYFGNDPHRPGKQACVGGPCGVALFRNNADHLGCSILEGSLRTRCRRSGRWSVAGVSFGEVGERVVGLASGTPRHTCDRYFSPASLSSEITSATLL